MCAFPSFRERTGQLGGHCGSFGSSLGRLVGRLDSSPSLNTSLNNNLHGIHVTVGSGKANGDNNTHVVAIILTSVRSNLNLLCVCSGSRQDALGKGRLASLLGGGNLI